MTGRRSRLLFLCHNLPFPPDGGALIRSFHTLRLLARQFEVTALCFFRAATRPDRQAVDAAVRHLSRYGLVESFPIPQERSRLRFAIDHARSVIGGRAYTRWAYDSGAFRRRLSSLLKSEQFDLAHLDSLDLVGYLPALSGLPVVVAHHNVESQLLSRRADAVREPRAAYLRRQATLTRREERKWCPRVSLNVVVSREDEAVLTQIAPAGQYLVVPNGVDTSLFTPAPPGPRRGIVFVGGATWFPNLDGMEYFLRDIMPLIQTRLPDVRVTWVGRMPDELRRRLLNHQVAVTGYVDDIRPYMTQAACFIVPLQVGGGTRLKILDAWALGKAVVSTSAGSEGLATRDGANILIADDPDAFSAAVVRVLTNAKLRTRLEKEARATAVELYDWEVVARDMLRAYDELVVTP